MAGPDRVLVVTGATGYIGRTLVGQALAAGWHVRVLGRRPVAGLDWVAFDLARPLSGAAGSMLFGADAVIHLAAETRGADRDDAAEIAAALAIMESAAPGARVVLVSSQTARPDAPSAYGRRKYALEQALGPLGAILVRPGLVYGGSPQGLYQALCRLVERCPVLPRLWPEPVVRPVHVDDLCAGLLALAGARVRPERPVGLAQPDPVPFSVVLRLIAEGRRGRPPVLIPVPAAMARLAARLLPKRTGEQLASLLALPPLPDDGGLGARFGLELAPISALRCVWPPAERRRLLTEAAVLMAHASGSEPPPMALRRYVRGCRVEGLAPLPGGRCRLRLAAWVNDPALLRGLALKHPSGAALQARLRMAMIVAETCPALAERFFWPPDRGRRRAWVALARTLAGEGLRLAVAAPWLMARALIRRLRPAR